MPAGRLTITLNKFLHGYQFKCAVLYGNNT